MNVLPLAVHITACAVIGGVVSALTPAKWLAAALWVSAGLSIIGWIAEVEDGQPGGFNNPDGEDPPWFAQGFGAAWFAVQSLGITAALALAGLYIQSA